MRQLMSGRGCQLVLSMGINQYILNFDIKHCLKRGGVSFVFYMPVRLV